MVQKDLAERFEVIIKIQHYIFRDFSPEIPVGLKRAEVSTLISIFKNEGRPMSFYCDKVGIEHGSFTYLTDKLENKGLIYRGQIDGDRRKKGLFLTPEGKELAQELERQFFSHVQKRLADFSDDERQRFENALEILERLFSEKRL